MKIDKKILFDYLEEFCIHTIEYSMMFVIGAFMFSNSPLDAKEVFSCAFVFAVLAAGFKHATNISEFFTLPKAEKARQS